MNQRILISAALIVLLNACASGPVPPNWQINSHDALENYTHAYLEGNTRVADAEFARVQSEIAATGKLELRARAMLARCAAAIAALAAEKCADDADADAGAQERAYAAFLRADFSAVNSEQLSPQHRPILSAKSDAEIIAALTAVKDPLARLIQAGVLFQAKRLPPQGISIAVDTASERGWRRPLLSWLGVLARQAEASGQAELAAQTKRRMAMVTEGK